MWEVWQNLSPFGGRPIGTAVEVLLTKVVNQPLSVSPIVFFFYIAATVSLSQPNGYSQWIVILDGPTSFGQYD
jgi:hypothetical protein